MKSINVDNRMNRACLIASGLLTLILFLNPRTGRSDQLAGGANHGRALRPHSAESLSDDPSAEEITGCQVFSGPLIMNQGQMPVAAENAALSAALKKYATRAEPDELSSITGFLEQFPDSTWKVSLLTNLGTVYLSTGYFEKAMDAWETAWNEGKSSTDPAMQAIADRAVSQFARLTSLTGRVDRLESLFSELKGRHLAGPSGQYLLNARETHRFMIDHPEKSFRCGPLAIEAILASQKSSLRSNPLIGQCLGTKKGISLETLKELSDKLGMNYQLAKRSIGAPIIFPAVVHWKVGHFGALLAEAGNRFQLQDPGLGENISITAKAVDAESSGYFLIPNGTLPPGWQPVSSDEAASIWGKGPTSTKDPNRTTNCDNPSGGDSGGGCTGMPSYTMHTMLVSLFIKDTPLVFRPPVGPALDFTLSYSQRGMLPTNVTTLQPYANLGQWTHNWLSFITDDPLVTSPAELDLYVRGGGIRPYYFQTGQTVSQPQSTDQSTLTILLSGTLANYVINYTDGSQQSFSTATPVDGPGRMVFLNQIVDSSSNQVLLSYDTNTRLTSIQGSSGASLNLTYNLDNSIAMVTSLNALAGGSSRSAYFGYTSGILTSSTDAVGMASSFGYTGSFISTMTTPYGTTTFSEGDSNDDNTPGGAVRWLQATDPAGATERLESSDSAPGIPYSDGTNTVPQNLGLYGAHLDVRNSFYWSKKAFMDAPGDYTKAVMTHFMHLNSATESGVVESKKAPLENTVWYLYPNEVSNLPDPPYVGTSGNSELSGTIARVLDSNNPQTTTQIYRYQYNAAGNRTQVTDPVGRVTSYTYAPNNIDVIGVYQENPAGTTTDSFGQKADQIVAYTYNTNSQHKPYTVTDAAGQTTTFSYNAQGQRLTKTVVRNSNPETTTWNYNGNGFLQNVTGAISSATTSYTYDGWDRVQTVTDSQGYQLAYSYDALDRLTSVTFPDYTTEQTIYNRRDVEWKKDRLNRWTHYLHDQLGRLTFVVDPAGNTTQYQYCPCGALTAIIDGNQNTTSFMQDVQSRLTEKIYADRSTVSYTYEPATSRLQMVTDAKQQVTTYTYGLDNTLAGVSYSGTSTPSVVYTYDPVYHRIQTISDSVSGVSTYNYNPSSVNGSKGGGMLGGIVNSGPASYTLSYGYDELGQVVSRAIDGGTNTETTGYDALGRVTQVTNALGGFTYTPYNATNKVDHINYPNGQVVQYHYFTSGASNERLQTISNQGPVSDPIISQFGYGYDAAGSITAWTQQADNNTPVTYAYGYDGTKELLSALKTSSTSQTALDTYAYRYDPAENRLEQQTENRLEQQINNAVTSSAYNNLNQVTSVSGSGLLTISGSLSESGTVSVAGTSVLTDTNNNFTIVAPVVPGPNNIAITATHSSTSGTSKVLQVNVASGVPVPLLQYDPDGNLTNDGTRTYTWDASNRLTGVTEVLSGSSSQFSYDGLNRRIQITESNSNGVVTSTKNLIWDGMTIREERNASNAVTKMYFYNGVQVSGSNYYYTRDHLGSIRELTDANGFVQARYDYDPYGLQTQLTGTMSADFGFTGLYSHQPSGLVLAPYRAYSSSLGRWISRDPIGDPSSRLIPHPPGMAQDAREKRMLASGRPSEILQGPNLYAYVQNDPIINTDPEGENLQSLAAAAAMALNNFVAWNNMIGGDIQAFWDLADDDAAAAYTQVVLPACKEAAMDGDQILMDFMSDPVDEMAPLL